jgi:1-deoxy-D-xylulose-5-phosphate reductoisomerase
MQAVEMFIDERIHYLDIFRLNEAACEAHKRDLVSKPSLEDIINADQWARRCGPGVDGVDRVWTGSFYCHG